MPIAHMQQGEREAGGCTRCGGLLVEEYCMDLSNSEHATAAQRCVQCGELVDPVILANRTRAGTPSSKTNRISAPSSHCTEDTMTTGGPDREDPEPVDDRNTPSAGPGPASQTPEP